MGPVIVPIAPIVGVGFTVIDWQLAKPDPHPLLAVQQTLPEVLPKVIVTEFVPCPAVMVAPAGTVHVLRGSGGVTPGTV